MTKGGFLPLLSTGCALCGVSGLLISQWKNGDFDAGLEIAVGLFIVGFVLVYRALKIKEAA